jgi:predicted O-methyltransferase YrrM
VAPRRTLLAFPEPRWLAGHSEPNIDAILVALDDEARQLYRRYLADEVRAMRPGGILPAWRAFDRAMCEVHRRNRERRQR